MVPTRELAIDVTAFTETTDERPAWEEPVSPMGRLFLERRLNCYIVCVFALGAPVDLAALRHGLQTTLVRHPRFCSVQVEDKSKKGATPKWFPTTVNLDDHVIVPDQLNRTAKLGLDADRAMEDYLSSLSTLPMDHSRPLWEVHVLDFPTAEAASAVAFRVHHSLGDGVSLLSLFVACAGPPADPTTPPNTAKRRPGMPPPHPPISAVLAWFVSVLTLAWHTLVDVVRFVGTTSSILRDPPTLLKGAEGVEFRPKRFVNRTLSLDDVKHVKNAMNYTVNDVLLGVTSAALSRYYFRKTGDPQQFEDIMVRSTIAVNLRKTPGLHALASMMDTGKDNNMKWGNQLGFMILPFHISKHDNLLEYVQEAAKVARRKKSSSESVFTYKCTSMLMKIFGVKAAASVCHRMFRNTTLLYSNVVGPSELVVLFGHPIVYIAPSVYGLPNSYMNIIKVVLAVDEARFPDAHDLLDDFADSLNLIRETA